MTKMTMTTCIRDGRTIEVGLGLDYEWWSRIGLLVLSRDRRRHAVSVQRETADGRGDCVYGEWVRVRARSGRMLHSTLLHRDPADIIADVED